MQLNPLSEARGRTCILLDTRRVPNWLSHNGNSPFIHLLHAFSLASSFPIWRSLCSVALQVWTALDLIMVTADCQTPRQLSRLEESKPRNPHIPLLMNSIDCLRLFLEPLGKRDELISVQD